MLIAVKIYATVSIYPVDTRQDRLYENHDLAIQPVTKDFQGRISRWWSSATIRSGQYQYFGTYFCNDVEAIVKKLVKANYLF